VRNQTLGPVQEVVHLGKAGARGLDGAPQRKPGLLVPIGR
jgi:hypothetical protein